MRMLDKICINAMLRANVGKKGTDEWTGSFYALRFGRTAECISR